jgi:lactate dehydrogenase-like 2-hydroxyacid dehydrogenase
MGLYCTNTPGVLDDSVAELTIGLILSAMRYMSIASAEIRHRHWCAIFGSELRGKTLAIIGCGAIGCRVARIASHGFGMSVVGCDVMPLDATELISEFGFSDMAGDFASAVSEADVVSLHIPATSETRHFIDRDRLALMPNAAWLVNTSRGSIVDEAALYDAIADGRLAGAALDVFEHEPYEPVALDKDLRQLDDVIMTPHVGSSTREACNRMARRALQNIAAAEAGRFSDMDIINPAILDQ